MAADEPNWAKIARHAGLDRALSEFPDDVAAAAASAAAAVAGLAAPADPRDEPWPPMRMGPAL